MYVIKALIFLLVALNQYVFSEEGTCSKAFGCSGNSPLGKTSRYILYDVNPAEGFNLRRDVYMRMAIFMHNLVQDSKYDWHLVLPPWNKLWHWKNEESNASYPWQDFFDLPSLQLFAPVMELEDFINDYGAMIDEAYKLQHFPDFYSWSEGKEIDWSERWNYSECRDSHKNKSEKTFLFFRGKLQVTSKHFKCISFHGTSGFLESVISSTSATAIMFDRAEIVTHGMYGDSNYWMCRRSMRFARHLVEAANNFRAIHLNSSDDKDGTTRPIDFREEKPGRSAVGGPYLGVHLRRQEFLSGHPEAVPSLFETVEQIKKYLMLLNLTTVFIATDATDQEYAYIRSMLRGDNFFAIKFVENRAIGKMLKDAELAIIDQIIVSHARFFVGTFESTFTYRIQEEREIMGFPSNTTFNRFCPTSSLENCTPPTKWLIKYPEEEEEPWIYSDTKIRSDFQSDEL